MGIRTWFKSVRAKLRDALSAGLPALEDAWANRRVLAAALRRFGDRVAALEPEKIADLEYVAAAARIAQASGLGNQEKREAVIEAVRKAWAAVGIADAVFDSWWEEWGDPFLSQFCDEAKGHGLPGWVKTQ